MSYLYICNTASDNISVINMMKFTETYKIKLGNEENSRVGPHGICQYRNNLIVANNYSNDLSLVDTECGSVIDNFFIGMHCNDVKVYNSSAYVICGDSNKIVVLNMNSFKVEQQIPCGNFPHSLDICFKEKIMVTADLCSDSITVGNCANFNNLQLLKVGQYPTKAVFTSDGEYIVVCESNIGSDCNGSVRVISVKNMRHIGSIAVGRCPVDMYCEGYLCYVSNFGDGTISIVDISKGAMIANIHTGGMPRGIIKHGHYLYVGDNYNNEVIQVNTQNLIKKSISIGREPTGMISY
ncbi:MAG: YncE family protein [Bacillota bacterium]|nr:YncE family protein [Bacillota bacterium]